MKAYRKPSGVYIELSDNIPVSNTLVRVAPRPSVNHVFADNWQTDPLNPAVCWRLKTAAEMTAEKDGELQAHLDSVAGKIDRAIINVLISKGVFTLAELRTAYRAL